MHRRTLPAIMSLLLPGGATAVSAAPLSPTDEAAALKAAGFMLVSKQADGSWR